MGCKIDHLPNRVRTVTVPMEGRRSVALGVWVNVGGRDEKEKESGVSHFLEHMVFKGTGRRTAYRIKEEVEGVGGSLNAFTSEENTCYYAQVASRHLAKVFDVLSDMVLDPALKQEDMDKERTVIMEEIKMSEDVPSQLVDEIFTEVLWPDHPLGRNIAGTLKTVGAMNREDLERHRCGYYRPPYITVAAAGDVREMTLPDLVGPRFKDSGEPDAKSVELFSGDSKKALCKTAAKKTEQTHLCLGFHGLPKDDPDERVLDLMNIVLGGNMSSRLFNEVREERGLAYEIGSFVRRYRETGVFAVSAGVDNRKVGEAIRVIAKEFDKMKRKPVSEGELQRAKDFFIGQMELGLESVMSHMFWAGESVISRGHYRNPEDIMKRVRQVTAEDIRRLASQLLKPDALRLAAVGPETKAAEGALSEVRGIF